MFSENKEIFLNTDYSLDNQSQRHKRNLVFLSEFYKHDESLVCQSILVYASKIRNFSKINYIKI